MSEAEVQRLMGLARRWCDVERRHCSGRADVFDLVEAKTALESALRELLPAGIAAPAAQQPDPHADIVAWANQSADPSWPWPTVTRYSGGASTEGLHGRVWLRLQDGGPDLEYVPATTAPAAPEVPADARERCRCGFPAPCTRTVPVGFCGATTQEQKP